MLINLSIAFSASPRAGLPTVQQLVHTIDVRPAKPKHIPNMNSSVTGFSHLLDFLLGRGNLTRRPRPKHVLLSASRG